MSNTVLRQGVPTPWPDVHHQIFYFTLVEFISIDATLELQFYTNQCLIFNHHTPPSGLCYMYEESVPMRSILVAGLHPGYGYINYLFLGLHTIISRNMLPTVELVRGRHVPKLWLVLPDQLYNYRKHTCSTFGST